ncbi:C40 family peptidase [Desulfolutivibrio sp.]|uniref:C40 family peptidase n=1 Tax=Desulfolutivibrio sp. TaxID=2773296 RepID=UPI002F96B841
MRHDYPRPFGQAATRPGLIAAILALVATLCSPGCAFFSSTPGQKSLGDSLGARVADTARSQIGARYRYGGDTPGQGFDCSGLVQWAFAQNGLRVPRTVSDQSLTGRQVRSSELLPGDLVFFNTSFKRTELHVGIATSPGYFVHSPSSGGRVREARLSDPYWTSVFSKARRVIP